MAIKCTNRMKMRIRTLNCTFSDRLTPSSPLTISEREKRCEEREKGRERIIRKG